MVLAACCYMNLLLFLLLSIPTYLSAAVAICRSGYRPERKAFLPYEVFSPLHQITPLIVLHLIVQSAIIIN